VDIGQQLGVGQTWVLETLGSANHGSLGRDPSLIIFSRLESKARPDASLRLRPAAFFTHRH